MLDVGTTHETANNLRVIHAGLGVLLWIGLAQRFWARSQRNYGTLSERISMRTALLSWGFLSMATVAYSINRFNHAALPVLALGLIGQTIGVVYCAAAFLADRDHARALRKND